MKHSIAHVFIWTFMCALGCADGVDAPVSSESGRSGFPSLPPDGQEGSSDPAPTP